MYRFDPFASSSPAVLCSMDNGDCSHNCTVVPGEGVVCSCPLGMELGLDNKTCQIQSFCAKHLKCSQRCEQDKYSVKCSCYEGWELEPDMESCKSTGNAGVGRERWWRCSGRQSKQRFSFNWLRIDCEVAQRMKNVIWYSEFSNFFCFTILIFLPWQLWRGLVWLIICGAKKNQQKTKHIHFWISFIYFCY